MLQGTALGAAVELLVMAEVLVGSQGRLTASRMEPDIDHRDLAVAELGRYDALWLQVKGTAHPDSEGRVVAFADYPEASLPEDTRLWYAIALLDLDEHCLGRLWLVPSAEFNRLAYRERSRRAGRISLQFSCRASGDARWDGFELPPRTLAQRLAQLVDDLGPARPAQLAQLRES